MYTLAGEIGSEMGMKNAGGGWDFNGYEAASHRGQQNRHGKEGKFLF